MCSTNLIIMYGYDSNHSVILGIPGVFLYNWLDVLCTFLQKLLNDFNCNIPDFHEISGLFQPDHLFPDVSVIMLPDII